MNKHKVYSTAEKCTERKWICFREPHPYLLYSSHAALLLGQLRLWKVNTTVYKGGRGVGGLLKIKQIQKRKHLLVQNTKFSWSKQKAYRAETKDLFLKVTNRIAKKKKKTIQKAPKQASTFKLSCLNLYLADLLKDNLNFRYSSHQNFWNGLTSAAGTQGIHFVNADDSVWILRKYIFNHFI